MKRRVRIFTVWLLAQAACGFAFQSVYAQTDSVYSVNIVGFQKVVVPPSDVGGGLQLLGVPFDATPGNLDQIVGTHGTYGDSALNADNIIIFDPDAPETERYKRYYLRKNQENAPMWRTTGTTQVWATNVYLYPNDGFWYLNRATVAITNLFVGDVVEDDEFSMEIVPGLQLLSYPYSAPILLSDLGLTNGTSGGSALVADLVTLYDPLADPGKQYVRYYLRPDTNNTPTWRVAEGKQHWATNVTIQPYQGFWYQSRATSNFTWTGTKPYTLD